MPRAPICVFTASQLLGDPLGAGEFLRRVDVHEGDRGRAVGRDGGLGDLEHADALEEAGDLEASREEPFLDVGQAGLAVGRVQRLELVADPGNDDVGLGGPSDDEPRDLRVQEGHVAGDREGRLARRRLEARVDAAEGAVVGVDVGRHRQAEEGVEGGRVGDDQQIVDDGSDGVENPLDDAHAADLDQALGAPAHPRAPAAGLDDARYNVTAPARRIVGGTTVASTTVDGSPPAVLPASSTSSICPSNRSTTSRAVRGGGAPLGFALGAVTGAPSARTSASATGWPGIRMPTVPVPAVTAFGTVGRARSTTVSGPGQWRSMSARA